MPYFIPKSWKTGLNPSHRSSFDMANLTSTQKLELTRARIWGTVIGGNLRSGYAKMKKKPIGAPML